MARSRSCVGRNVKNSAAVRGWSASRRVVGVSLLEAYGHRFKFVSIA
jgi:hypothetical protein